MKPPISQTKQVLELSCPACGGPLSRIDTEGVIREFECLVSHRYTALTLLKDHSEAQERALWAAVVLPRRSPGVDSKRRQRLFA